MIYQIEQKKDEALVKMKNNLLLCHVQQNHVYQISYYIQYICFHDISYVYAWMEEPLVAEAVKSEKKKKCHFSHFSHKCHINLNC